MIKENKTWKVYYQRATGKRGYILILAKDNITALDRAKEHCHTGTKFELPEVTDEQYMKPRKQGFYAQ